MRGVMTTSCPAHKVFVTSCTLTSFMTGGACRDIRLPHVFSQEPITVSMLRTFGSMRSLCSVGRSERVGLKNKSHDPHSLTDTFARKHDYLRISLTEKCNLRCQYCMPEEGVKLSPRIMTTDHICQLGSFFVRSGVKKIRLTGGGRERVRSLQKADTRLLRRRIREQIEEKSAASQSLSHKPLVRPDFFHVLTRLSSLREHGLKTLAVTTNAIALNETRIQRLREEGLDAINISLDTLQPQKFEFISRRKGWHLVMRNIKLAMEAGFPNRVKVNVVVMKGLNDDELTDFVRLTQDSDLDIRFIEYMPFHGNRWSNNKLVSYREMLSTIRKEFPTLAPIVNEGSFFNQTSKPFQVDGFKGRIGFITSMTNNFCSTCNRIRLTADGHLKVCLFGQEEVSLLHVLGDKSICQEVMDHHLMQVVQDSLSRKKKQHAGSDIISKSVNRPMIFIEANPSSFPISIRLYSTKSSETGTFTHLDQHGQVKMVDVSPKVPTERRAVACAKVKLGSHVISEILKGQTKKGDVISTVKVAGIMAAKKTSSLIPLCHPLNLTNMHVDVNFEGDYAEVTCSVKTRGRTGVEMEALTGVTVSSLTLYDMVKSIKKDVVIEQVYLVSKTGGKSDSQ